MEKNITSWESLKDLEMTSIEKYFTMATSARQSIQYDQGEDRWLCTLLITRGWEVSHINHVTVVISRPGQSQGLLYKHLHH